eukprot:2920469-Rhodomonas_salina.2
MRCPVLTYRMVLAPLLCNAWDWCKKAFVRDYSPVLTARATCLCVRYAMSGTDIAYVATRSRPTGSTGQVGLPPYARATPCL